MHFSVAIRIRGLTSFMVSVVVAALGDLQVLLRPLSNVEDYCPAIQSRHVVALLYEKQLWQMTKDVVR